MARTWPQSRFNVPNIVAMFGADLVGLACHHVAMDGQPFCLFELRWRTTAAPPVVARQPSDRMVLSLRTAPPKPRDSEMLRAEGERLG